MSELPKARSDRVLLRASDVDRWVDERDKLLEQITQIREKIEELEQKLHAAALLSSTEIVWTAGDSGQAYLKTREEPESMSQAAERIVKTADKPLLHPEIQRVLRENPDFRQRLNQNPNYYYTLIARLVKRKKITKRGSKYGPPSPEKENAKDADHA